MASKSKLLQAQIKEGRRQIKAIADDVRREIAAKVSAAAAKGNFIASAAVRNNLYKEIAADYVRLNKDVNDWTRDRATVVSKAWHTLAVDDIGEAAEASFTFGQFSKKYFDDIVGKINPSTIGSKVAINPRIQGMFANDIRAIRTAVSETIREGALTGMNNIQLTKEMIVKANAIKPGVQFTDAADRTWNSESYFGMLNRTLHANVARETYDDTIIESGFDLVRVNGISSDPDSPCIPFQGEILSLTGQTKGYTTMAEAEAAGLHHPNCIHFESIYIPELTKAEKTALKEAGIARK